MNEFFALEYLTDPNKRLFWIYIISSIVLGILYFYINKKNTRVIMSSKLWLHPSAKLDYYYFFLSYFINNKILMNKNASNLIDLFESQFNETISINKNYNILMDLLANEWIAKAKKLPDPKPIFGTIFHEGEVAILFSNTGKVVKEIFYTCNDINSEEYSNKIGRAHV